jgi:hypothetical protein
MLTLVTGLPGASKTLYTLDSVEKLAKKDNRPVFYHGIPELTLDWQMLEKAEDWINCPDGSIIVIDECQSAFRPRANGQTVPPHVAKFETHRHHGLDIFLITQHPMLVDGNVRRLAGRHYHVVRFYGFNKSTVHEFDKVRENVDKNLKGSIENHYIYNKEVYKWYKSSTMHTVKKRVPMRLLMIVALPLVLLYLIYTGYQILQGVGESSKAKNEAAAAEVEKNDVIQNQAPVPVRYDLEYVNARVPVVADLPQSAEVYKEVIKPITAPYAAACISSKTTCKCFTQQATPLTVSDAVCRQIALGGQFIDFETQPKRAGRNGSRESGGIGGSAPDDGSASVQAL